MRACEQGCLSRHTCVGRRWLRRVSRQLVRRWRFRPPRRACGQWGPGGCRRWCTRWRARDRSRRPRLGRVGGRESGTLRGGRRGPGGYRWLGGQIGGVGPQIIGDDDQDQPADDHDV